MIHQSASLQRWISQYQLRSLFCSTRNDIRSPLAITENLTTSRKIAHPALQILLLLISEVLVARRRILPLTKQYKIPELVNKLPTLFICCNLRPFTVFLRILRKYMLRCSCRKFPHLIKLSHRQFKPEQNILLIRLLVYIVRLETVNDSLVVILDASQTGFSIG